MCVCVCVCACVCMYNMQTKGPEHANNAQNTIIVS